MSKMKKESKHITIYSNLWNALIQMKKSDIKKISNFLINKYHSIDITTKKKSKKVKSRIQEENDKDSEDIRNDQRMEHFYNTSFERA